MNNTWQDGEIDPDFAEGFKSGFTPDRPLLRRLGKAIRDTPGDIWDMIKSIGGEPDEPGYGGEGEPDLPTTIARGLEEYRNKDVPATPTRQGAATRQGAMDQGRDEYGTAMPEGGSMRIGQSARPGGVEEAAPAPAPVEQIGAELDYIFAEGASLAHSRMRRVLAESVGKRTLGTRAAARAASDAYAAVTGRDPVWTADDLTEVLTDPATAEIILQGL